MTGIYDCFGYGSGYDVSFEERYKLIRKSLRKESKVVQTKKQY